MASQSDSPLEQVPLHNAVIEAGTLQTFIGMLTPVTERAHLHVTEEGYKASATDPATVATVTTRLDRGGFQEYESQDVDFGVNLLRVDEMIGFGETGEASTITYARDPESLCLELTGLQYSTSLEDPETIRASPSLPELNSVFRAEFKGKKLKQAIQAADLVGEAIRIRAAPKEEKITFSADGDVDSMQLSLSEADASIQEIECLQEGGAMFDLDYLKNISRPMQASTDLTVECGDEAPLKISFTAADGAMETTYLIAPRLDS